MSPTQSAVRQTSVALDIGSTVIKVARLTDSGELESQVFFPRDFERGIARQVLGLLADLNIDYNAQPILACSSANGGLRVGIICLSEHFSGSALRNQVLLAGANPVFVHELANQPIETRYVDLLLVAGGIDCADPGPLKDLLLAFDPQKYRYGAMVYSGNRFLADDFVRRFPGTRVIVNPLGDSLSDRVGSVFETVRRTYLDDLVFKEGVSELPSTISRSIRPTPEVASRGFLRSVINQSSFAIVGACIALDIGGATTDLHYTVEIVSEESAAKPSTGLSVARYVFTDLGIVASRDTLTQQLRSHPLLHEFLLAVGVPDVRETYATIREGDQEPSSDILSYACLFLALDRFAAGNGPGLPTGRLDLVEQIILTGGAAQSLDESVVSRIVAMLLLPETPAPLVQIDRRYEIWVAGISWQEEA